MLAACAARLAGCKDLVWVDLGGGTGVSGGRWMGMECLESPSLRDDGSESWVVIMT